MKNENEAFGQLLEYHWSMFNSMHVSGLFTVRLYVTKSGRYIDTALRTPHITTITDLFVRLKDGCFGMISNQTSV